MDPNKHSFSENLNRIKTRLDELGRPDVRIIAVSKTHAPHLITEMLQSGQRDFGENRQNEARDKFPLVEVSNLTDNEMPIYHHIGPLQSGNARQMPGLFTYVHGVSSSSALDSLLKAALRYYDNNEAPSNPDLWPMRYLIQISLTDENTKLGGVTETELKNFPEIPENAALRFCGFMTMGPQTQDSIETREAFHRLRDIRDEILPGGELSMGMSGDWELAVLEGATMIRLGTVLFGNVMLPHGKLLNEKLP